MSRESHSTCLPLDTNSIGLDPELEDSRGLPALHMTFKNRSGDAVNCPDVFLKNIPMS